MLGGARRLVRPQRPHLGARRRVFVALMMSFLVSYTRARAEALGLECKVGLMPRGPSASWCSWSALLFARYHVLTVMVWALAVLTTYTVVQRILHVRRQLAGERRGAPSDTAGRRLRAALRAPAPAAPASPRPAGAARCDILRAFRQLAAALPRPRTRSPSAGRAGREVEVDRSWAIQFASRSSVWATAPRRSSRASSSTRTPRRPTSSPGSCTPCVGGYHIRDIEFVAAIDIDKNKVGKDLSEAIFTKPNNTVKFADVPAKGVKVARGMTHDGLGKYLSRDHREGARPHRRHRRHPQRDAGRRGGQLPAGGQRRGHQVVRRADPHGRLRHGQLHPGVHRPRALLAEALRRGRRADHRRRHQEPGGRHHRAPRAHAPHARARRQARAHQPAQRGRQHRLPQHARARAPGVQEDLQDQRRHQPARLRHGRQERAHRPQRLRRVARRPQVGLHPHGGPHLRRRAAQHRAQARGRRLAQLRRHRHRRRALRQDRPRPRPLPARSRRPARTS